MSLSHALSYNTKKFLNPIGPSFQDRSRDYLHWVEERSKLELFQYGRTLAGSPGPCTPVYDPMGRASNSLNFASQDYLGLSSHHAIKDAATKVIHDFGVHSAGSPMVIGETRITKNLVEMISNHIQMKHVLIFPTGWAAGFGAISGLVREYDHIVMDRLAHASLQLGAVSTRSKIHKHAHLDIESVRGIFKEIRENNSQSSILVVSEGLFSMDADSPDLRTLQDVCHEYGALLMVDVAHDLGSTGPAGTGEIGRQLMTGKLDLVMGSFSKTFASNGGFVATNSSEIFEYLRMFSNSYMFSNALSPVQAAVVEKAFEIVQSNEGDVLRKKLNENAVAMRDRFLENGVQCYGKASPIVPVPIGHEGVSRLVFRDLRRRDIAAMVIEYPIVAVGAARLRIQLMASHTQAQVIAGCDAICEVIDSVSKSYTKEDLQKDS